eukprot:19664-Pelagococcus_subviridis.AAC.2
MYARVRADAKPAPGEALARVAVETSPGVVRELLSSEVFTFGLSSEGGAGDGDGDEDEDARAPPPPPPNEIASDADGDSDDADGDSNDAASAANAAGVTADELIGAVRDMLQAAGAPPTLEQTTLLASQLKMKADLAAAAEAAATARRETAAVAAAAETAAKAFHCPITQSVMRDPVIAVDGHTYERRAIEEWFSRGRSTSPVTNLRVSSTTLIANHALRGVIAAYEARGLTLDA